MRKPNILMFHRVELNDKHKINSLYYKCKMVCKIDELFHTIKEYYSKGCKPGSIEQCFNSQKNFHLSFDDGFKEHLQLANLLKNKYKLNYNNVSFSINTNNSFTNKYTGMDIVYEIFAQGEKNELCDFLEIQTRNSGIKKIKEIITKLEPNKLIKINNEFKTITNILNDTFLNEKEVIELSKIFEITSHGITHRYLTYHNKESEKEISQSKISIEKRIGKQVNTFCYPEGKNDNSIQEYCKNAGYKFALSIRHEKDNKYCIGRKVM